MSRKVERLFIAYIAPGNKLGLTRYQRSVVTGIPRAALSKSLLATLAHRAIQDRDDTFRLWATGRGPASQRFHKHASPGDEIVFIVGDRVVAIALVVGKCESRELAEAVWGTDWFSLFYFLANVRPLDVSRESLTNALGYKTSMKFRGLTVVSSAAAKRIFDRFDSLATFFDKDT